MSEAPNPEKLTQAVFAGPGLTGQITEPWWPRNDHVIHRAPAVSLCQRLLRRPAPPHLVRCTPCRRGVSVTSLLILSPFVSGLATRDDALQLSEPARHGTGSRAATRLAAEVPFQKAQELFTPLPAGR